jgi:hypothetical protein
MAKDDPTSNENNISINAGRFIFIMLALRCTESLQIKSF